MLPLLEARKGLSSARSEKEPLWRPRRSVWPSHIDGAQKSGLAAALAVTKTWFSVRRPSLRGRRRHPSRRRQAPAGEGGARPSRAKGEQGAPRWRPSSLMGRGRRSGRRSQLSLPRCRRRGRGAAVTSGFGCDLRTGFTAVVGVRVLRLGEEVTTLGLRKAQEADSAALVLRLHDEPGQGGQGLYDGGLAGGSFDKEGLHRGRQGSHRGEVTE